MRSRNQRSWLITTAHPPNSSNASSRARNVPTSRSLVGSSRSRTLPPLFHQRSQMESVPLSSREVLHLLLLIRPPETELAGVGAGIDFVPAHQDQLLAAVGDLLPHRAARPAANPGSDPRTRAPRSHRFESVPASGDSSPTIIRKRVVLPAPLGPTTPTMPPAGKRIPRPP